MMQWLRVWQSSPRRLLIRGLRSAFPTVVDRDGWSSAWRRPTDRGSLGSQRPVRPSTDQRRVRAPEPIGAIAVDLCLDSP